MSRNQVKIGMNDKHLVVYDSYVIPYKLVREYCTNLKI